MNLRAILTLCFLLSPVKRNTFIFFIVIVRILAFVSRQLHELWISGEAASLCRVGYSHDTATQTETE